MPGGKYFFLKSKMNGMVLDVQAGCTEPGTQVFMWDQKDDDFDNQLFYADLVNGVIRSKMNDFCLEVDDSNTLVLNPLDEGCDKQKWQVSGDRIVNTEDMEKVLDVAQKEDEERARVCMWDWHGDDNQRWEIEHAEANYFFIVSEMHDKVIDVRDGDPSPGNKAIMYDKNDDGPDNQLWYEDRLGNIRSKLNDFVLDCGKGNSIQLQPFEPGNEDQLWQIVDNKIECRCDRGQVLDIQKKDDSNGAKLCKYRYKGKDNQHWKIEYFEG